MERRVRVPDLEAAKRRGEKISILTAYDATMARVLDAAGVDALLVGDSLGVVVLGHETTLPVTLDAMIHHTRAVARGARRALVIADMPFLTYQVTAEEAIRNAGRLLQEGGAAAVKVEGGRAISAIVGRMTAVGIPVMGHLGLLPQSIHQVGGYRRRGGTPAEAGAILDDAAALEAAGAFAIVLEAVPPDLAAEVTRRVAVPTIGIASGPHCDGQVLVSYDMLGLFDPAPPFVKPYARLAADITAAVTTYVEDVRAGRDPSAPRGADASGG